MQYNKYVLYQIVSSICVLFRLKFIRKYFSKIKRFLKSVQKFEVWFANRQKHENSKENILKVGLKNFFSLLKYIMQLKDICFLRHLEKLFPKICHLRARVHFLSHAQQFEWDAHFCCTNALSLSYFLSPVIERNASVTQLCVFRLRHFIDE